ncbi:SRPBCC domain-containing protein [Flaviaesturariibacter amylovorans]|uniref:Activator of Hsp90 ATPase homologue 1/2-like C-terminal domain-containing protein n=1 Tax=Flaviaesturariibacter amylovorans TaxID=1084520 RepID=A0ABP8HGN5_9BACT
MEPNTKTLELEIEYEFDAPADALYRAWTEEEALRQWWRPMGNELVRLTNEIEPGGRVEYEFQTTEGAHAFTIRGTYKEVEPGRRLVYSWDWELPTNQPEDASFVLHVSFQEAGKGSRLQVRQEQFKSEETVQPHREGWEQGLQSLARYLEQNR